MHARTCAYMRKEAFIIFKENRQKFKHFKILSLKNMIVTIDMGIKTVRDRNEFEIRIRY